jgi:hypothetical protein
MKRQTTIKGIWLGVLLGVILAACGGGGDNNNNNGGDATANENAIVLDDNNGANYNPVIDPTRFVGSIDNPHFNLIPGRRWVYEGVDSEGVVERVEVDVTPDTRVILGVTTTVVQERAYEDGELVEDTLDWYAQDLDGTVWYFGEDSKNIDAGQIVSTAGSWEAGVNGAKPGILMKGSPQVGDAYRQEFLAGEAEDMAEVLSMDESVQTAGGTYDHCLQIKEWTPLEPDVVEHKFYCQEIGNVVVEQKVVGGEGRIELIEMTP